MAVLDQDNFSNISWHSEQNPDGAGPSTSASHDPNDPDYNGNRAGDEGHDDDGHSGGEILECVVSDPHKENDGTKDAYVSYLITTNVCYPKMESEAPADLVDHLLYLPTTHHLGPPPLYRLCFPLQGARPRIPGMCGATAAGQAAHGVCPG
jgi:hypothetical protein